MRLPAQILSRLRLGVGATALLVPACDAVEPAAAPTAQPALQTLPLVASAEAMRAAPREKLRLGSDLVAAAARPARADAPRPAPSGDPLAVSPRARTTRVEDPTAFVPFSSDPARVEAMRPREATPPARTRRRVRRRVSAEPVVLGHTKPWGCPACGRG